MSLAPVAKALYFASKLLSETESCRLFFHVIGQPASWKMYPLVEGRVFSAIKICNVCVTLKLKRTLSIVVNAIMHRAFQVSKIVFHNFKMLMLRGRHERSYYANNIKRSGHVFVKSRSLPTT